MKRSVSVLSALFVASSLALGCSGAVGPDPTVGATASAVTTTEASRAPLVTASTDGKVKRVSDALALVTLRPDQRVQLQALATEAEAREAKVHAARQDLAETVAVQVTAGTLDRTALASKVSAMVDAMKAAEPLDRAAFESVHSILDASQRGEFADAIETQARDAHIAQGWQHLKGQGPGEKLADELKLTDDQRSAFKEVLHTAFAGHHGGPDHDGDHGHGGGPGGHGEGPGHGPGKALIEAFRGETFSFDAVAPPHDLASHFTEMSTHLLDAVEKVLPLLTAEQRTLAAQKIREHADHLPFGGPM